MSHAVRRVKRNLAETGDSRYDTIWYDDEADTFIRLFYGWHYK